MFDIGIAISVAALAVSCSTAYLTLFHRGRVKMTRPTVIFFGPDLGRNGSKSPKVYLRTLLYSTSKRGRVIESLHVRLRRGETAQVFNVWVYGEQHLLRGSGLFVGNEGVSFNHHFLLPKDGTEFSFLPGQYVLELYAKTIQETQSVLLGSETLELSAEFSSQMCWSNFHGHLDGWNPPGRGT